MYCTCMYCTKECMYYTKCHALIVSLAPIRERMEANEQDQSAVVSSDVGDPPESPLTVNTVANIIANVKEPSILALYLPGLDATLARIIDKNNSSDHFTLSQKYANAWLQNKKETPTWDKLIQALKEKPVSELTLAHDVEHYRRGSTTSTGSSFSNSLRSWNGSDLASSGNGDSLTRPGLSVKQRKVKDYTEDFTRTRIKRSFKMLTNKIAKELETQKVSVRTIKQCIVSDRIDDNPRLGSKMRECRRIAALFRFFETKKLWDFENYDLVTQVIELIEDEECKAAMRDSLAAYVKELNGYNIAQELATRLPYYLDEEYPECQEEEYDSWFCTELRKKLDCYVRITNESLQFVSELWTGIRDRYDIPSLTALLYSIVYGSLVVTWLIQPSWACCILREVLTSAAFFQEHLIVKVVLDGQCIYNEENGGITDTNALCSLWLKQASLSGRVQKFQEVLDQPDIDINTTLSETNETPLITASFHGHVELVRFLLDNGADSSATLSHLENGTSQSSRKMTNGQTALHLATIDGFSDVAGLLHRDNNELLGVYDQRGYSPLMEAADRNHVDVVRVFTEQYDTEVDSTEIPTLNEAFLLAVEKGHTEIVQILHRCGANTSTGIEPVAGESETPILVDRPQGSKVSEDKTNKSEQGETATEEVKIKAKDLKDKDPTIKAKKKTGGVIASILGKFINPFRRKSISEKLLAACHSKKPDITEIRGYLEQEECDVNIREDDEFQWSPLMWACENNHFEIGRLLLKYQPQVNIQDKKEWSPLVLASRAGDLEIVQGIVELGAEIDKPTNKLWTPLMWAADEGHARVVEFLLRKGAQVDFTDENGWTPLMQASQEGRVDVVNVLLDHGANANHQTDTTWCALMAAAKNKHSEVVDALLKRGAEVDLARNDGSTALQVASYYKDNSAVVNVLIEHKANLDVQNKDGMTPLMMATNKGHLDYVQALINGGADLDIQHPETGWPVIFFAAKSGNMTIFKELLHRGAKTEIEGTNVVEVASMFKRKLIVSELQKFEQASHRQISSHVPTLEPSPSTVVEPDIPTHKPRVDTPPTDTPTQQTGQVPLDTTSPKEEISGSTTAGGEVKPVATIVAEPVTTEAPEQIQQEPVTVSTESSKKDIEEVTPQDLGPEVATSDEVVGDSDQSALPTSTEAPTKAEPSESEKEAKILAASQTKKEQKQPSQISTKTTTKELSKPEQHSEAKKTSNIDIKRKADIIDLLLKGFGNRLADPKSNMYQGDPNEATIRKGVPSADVITHSSAKLIPASSSSQKTIQRDYEAADPDDLYSA